MWKNYLVIALRNIAKYRVFSAINVVGMAISLASFLLISLFVFDEWSYDQHHVDGARTFRVYNTVIQEGVVSELPIVPYPYASYLQRDFPEIESTLRILDTYEAQLFQVGDQKLTQEHGIISESAIFDMLSLQVIEGKPDSALDRPSTVALSASLANKLFGTEAVSGKTLRIDNIDREITAVFADPPKHLHLSIEYITSLSTTNWEKRFGDNFRRQQIFTYLKFKPNTDTRAFESKLAAFADKYANPQLKEINTRFIPHIQNIADIHLHSSNFQWELAKRGDAQTVYILAVTAVMILLIACLNFVNLSTARAMKRMKEVGIRKTTGANRVQLVVQFLSESILLTTIGLCLALVIAEASLPWLNSVVQKDLFINYTPVSILGSVALCLLLGALAGVYPAFFLSGYRPVSVLAKQHGQSTRGSLLRQALVVVQFMLSFFLVTASLVVLTQNDLIQTMDLGFKRDHVVIVPLRSPQLANQETTKQQYLNHPNVLSATIGFGLPGDIIAGDGVIDPVSNTEWTTSLFCIDHDYIKTIGLDVIAGRDFSPEFTSDSSDAFIVNETFLATYQLGVPQEAVGRKLDWQRWDGRGIKHGKIVGVVRDFHFKSLRDKVTPVVLHIFPGAAWKLAVRIKGDDITGTLDHLKKVYQ